MKSPRVQTREIRRPQLSEEVAGRLRAAIMTGELRPGEYIRMDETAAQLGVSVTPVREALLTLRGEGLVEAVPHRGYMAAALSRADIEDIFALQAHLAVELAKSAARRITPEQIDTLADLNDTLRNAGSPELISVAEFEFHRFLNHVADRPKLAWFLLQATRYTPHMMFASADAWARHAVDAHDKLIAALRAGDLAEVVAQTEVQFVDGARRLIEYLDGAGMWSGG
ncbi:GntR family transcriptional regulator [Mycobacteroides saopaulense]|uniref:GntR family transcriptional regulator n=1 Tax=Mycobacteroides saopaulense TaxID=1578165 RepID=A0A1S1JJC5_9MYCO|nr:GntR family transcriptional regulator [Mycobacteroides saopaulense]ALR13525.1 GntR family transcriptional regulator [Mycobacteroides saopaulense]OHT85108.1 GntR family transcriptional regulator [Mycobacteroides saopaulense]OHU11531.1 GntR family transcriptional regulator [Mycobacteroides saopaulense]ORB54382.1 GntR family transcriptional regulator [Mycobacteroides saopaulense]